MEGYILAAFRSRTQTMAFYERLKRAGCFALVVNTPREAHVGCGVSVRFLKSCLFFAKNEIFRAKFTAFAGFFEVRPGVNGVAVKSLEK